MSLSTPIDEFFARYPRFAWDPKEPVSEQFHQLRQEEYRWRRNQHPIETEEERKARETELWTEYQDALGQQFAALFGSDENDLEGWQKILRLLQVDPVPATLDDCRKVMDDKHVNILDLLDAHRTGSKVEIYRTEAALSAYTRTHRKIFNRHGEHVPPLLQALLRHILGPPLRDYAKRSAGDTDKKPRKGKGKRKGKKKAGQ
ncbi:hypothetical protein OF83DRAFT_1113354 [Amylostereum chailletii]|nr:hypothetical protein OF83DRAFT_1113354 [Amylostereum chailletii]